MLLGRWWYRIVSVRTRFGTGIRANREESHHLAAGMLLVVPRGCWHQFVSDRGVKVMTATPQPTEHLHVDDPRTVPAADDRTRHHP